jgi:DNA-binding LacI/PurR family transcriptional regulator
MATIQDIAADLGLSAMTVSRALNDHPDVKDETRQRVQERARELNYRPNRWARSLVTRESHIIGVVIPEISHTFFSEITAGLQEAIEARGYTLIVCNSASDPARERREIDMLLGSRADGLIVASAFHADEPELYEHLLDQHIPFVLIDRYFPGFECPRVLSNDRVSGALCAQHLIELGHRDIAFIKGSDVSVSRERFAGFEQALRDAGVGVKPEYVVSGDFDWRGGAEAASRLLSLSKIPTAICGVNDPCAMGAIRACRDAGLQVPRDISITGFGAIEFEYAPEPFLTTTETSRLELGRAAATMLLEIIEGRKPNPLEQLIEPRLVVRRSTAPPRKGTGAQ